MPERSPPRPRAELSELTPLIERLRGQRLTRNQAGIIWLGQAAMLVRIGDQVVFLDPFLSAHPARLVLPIAGLTGVSGIDVILCTHEHWDHLDLPTVVALASGARAPRVIVPEPLVAMVCKAGVSADQVIGAQPGRPITSAGLTIHPVPAQHGVHVADAYSFGSELSGGLVRYLGYVIDSGDVRVYHAGDTLRYDGHAEELERMRVDVALLPINGRDAQREAQDIVGNLDERDALGLATDAHVRLLIPMHFDMFARNPGDPAVLVRESLAAHRSPAIAVLRRRELFIYSAPQAEPGRA
jgi:L-ascorbate metabolism protein UlaG (beta-lactamase superfamily)